jgi:hemoglobin
VRCGATGTTVRVSVDSIGGHCNDLSTDPAIDGDGSPVAFFTLASTAGAGDTISCSINDQVNFTDQPDPSAPIAPSTAASSQQPTLEPIRTRKRPGSKPGSGNRQYSREDKVMAEPTLYERLGGIFAIAAVVDNFSDRLLRNPKIVDANPELHEWHTVTYHTRLPGLKWGRTLWLAALAGGPFEYTGREMRDAHFDLKIPPEVFDEVAAELANALDEFQVPEREKQEVLAGFAGEKSEVTAGSQPGAVNWRRWR